jgi:hypothetical protein
MSEHSVESGAPCIHSFLWRQPGDPFVPAVEVAHLTPCVHCGQTCLIPPAVGDAEGGDES